MSKASIFTSPKPCLISVPHIYTECTSDLEDVDFSSSAQVSTLSYIRAEHDHYSMTQGQILHYSEQTSEV